MTNKILIILGSFSFLFVLNCKNENTKIGGKLLGITAPQQNAVSTPGYVYGNHFRVQNSSLYETLLEACRRCGTKRFFTNPSGGTTYQRFWVHKTDPKECRNWGSKGYLQIEFAEKKLPTTATFLIQPQYTGPNSSWWGEPFEITARAEPINENKGFQIRVNPADGLGGVYSMIVRSDHSNHVKQAVLDVTITYGQRDTQTIVVERLHSLKEKAVKSSPFNCQTYTN